jgi:dGTPase
LKHCSRRNAQRLARERPGDVAERFLNRTQPSLEAQLCNVADEIAYNAHDIDDGVRSGLLTLQQMREVPLIERLERETLAQHPNLAGRRLLFEIIRRMLSELVYDVIDTTRSKLDAAAPHNADEARGMPPLVGFSTPVKQQCDELKRVLRNELYRHPQVRATTDQAKEVIRELFAAYLATPSELSAEPAPSAPLPRRVADYVAGMTDRFALREHHRLTGRRLFAQDF